MKKSVIAVMIFVAACCAVTSSLADDAEICLDCHEPAEDWEGMSIDEMLEAAQDPDNRRHQDNADLTEEQLRLIFDTLKPE
jgi:hypothetical protein